MGKTRVLNEKDAVGNAVVHIDLEDIPGILVQGK